MMVVMVRLDINLPAFAAFDDRAMRVAVRDADQQLRLARAAAISLVAAAFTQRFSGYMRLDFRARNVLGVYDHHVELRHGRPSSGVPD
jgi:hypothetical protein